MAANEELIRALTKMSQPFFKIWETTPLSGDLTQDVHKWFRSYEYQATLVAGIMDADKLLELKKSLRDRALAVCQGAPAATVASYALLKTHLTTSLVFPHQVAIWHQSLHSRKKEPGETIADYLRSLRELVKQAHSSASEEAQTLILKERFLEGLKTDPK